MSARDIPESEWPAALSEFSQDHRAWLTTVERIDTKGSRHVEAVERPLNAVTAELSARRVVGIAIQFQADSHGDIVHVDTPTRVRVDDEASGRAHALEIEDARGERTRIRFRNAPPLEALDGIAPGEV
jgi:Family of unknown function (DUF5335)